MHDLVIRLFINRYELGAAISHGINTFGTPSIAFSGNVLSPLRLSCDFNVLPPSSLLS